MFKKLLISVSLSFIVIPGLVFADNCNQFNGNQQGCIDTSGEYPGTCNWISDCEIYGWSEPTCSNNGCTYQEEIAGGCSGINIDCSLPTAQLDQLQCETTDPTCIWTQGTPASCTGTNLCFGTFTPAPPSSNFPTISSGETATLLASLSVAMTGILDFLVDFSPLALILISSWFILNALRKFLSIKKDNNTKVNRSDMQKYKDEVAKNGFRSAEKYLKSKRL